MGSQFVDLDADGKIDYLTATYDGSPHVALGTDDGFAEPRHLRDHAGKRVLLDQYWDYDAKEWTNTGAGNGHCTSAVAFDWDGDGDLDLLLGTYGDGNLYLQRNDGEPGKPRFTGVSEPVLAGGRPFELDGGITAPRLCDWDGDGLMDLVCGSYGDSYQGERAGGVYWYRNAGERGAPEFAGAVALIPPTKTVGHEADRPNVGLYADPVDYDGDGDLDLLVGGYSIWMPKQPELTAEQRARVVDLKASIEALSGKLDASVTALMESIEQLGEEQQAERTKAYYASPEYQRPAAELGELQRELGELEPQQQRVAGVWVYLR